MNAIELRESLRALAATILQIVQYEITEAEVIAALKENRRLTDELEKVLYKDYLCRQIDQRLKQDLIDEAAAAMSSQYMPVTLTEQDKKMSEAQAYTTEQIAKLFKVPESYIIHSGPAPAREAMADIVKSHLMPPDTRSTPEKRPDWINAPFITRGKAE